MLRRLASLVAAATALGALVVPARAADCQNDPSKTPEAHATFEAAHPGEFGHTQDIDGFAEATGHYVVPENPTALVAMMHGYTNISDSWMCWLLEAKARGAAAFALDYRGTGPAPDNRGWFVQEGATDSIALAKHFLAEHDTITETAVLGISMGGNASGLVIADTGAAGEETFDHWIDVEGVTNVRETWSAATAVGPFNAFAANAAADIEQEAGGKPWEVPQEYSSLTILDRVGDVAASGADLIVVHGVDDGLVPYDQSVEFVAAARAAGIPTDFYTVGRRGSGEPGTTLSGNILGPVGQTPTTAGHGWEGSRTQVVIRTSFDLLWGLLGNAAVQGGDFVVDGDDSPRRIR